MKKIYDVIIVGAGPAGAGCGYFSARKNIDVLILEQMTFPREKACGGAVPTSVINSLPFLRDRIEDFVPLHRVGYSFRGTRACERSTSSAKVYSVDRRSFDFIILEEARMQNCTVEESQKVVEVVEHKDQVSVTTRKGDTFRARYVVIASGALSLPGFFRDFRKKRPRARDLACASLMEFSSEDKSAFEGKVHVDFAFIKNGYAGVIPKKDHLAICLYQNSLSSKKYLRQKSQEFARLSGINRSALSFSTRVFEVYVSNKRLNTERIFLTGDAGGLVDPLSGEGIRHALRSAQIASEVLGGLMQSKGDADDYSRRICSEIGKELLIAKQFVLIGHALPSITYGGLINVSEEAGDVLNGSISYSVLLERLKKRIWRKLGGVFIRPLIE